jgi:hypothetical protein
MPSNCKEVFAIKELGYLIGSQWDGASTWFQEFIDQCINADSKAMIRIIFRLSWCQFRHNDKARDASWIRAFIYNRSSSYEPSYDKGTVSLPFPVHGLGTGHLLLSSFILRQ